MEFLFTLIILGLIARAVTKAMAKKKAEDQQRLWIARQRLSSQQVHVGEVIDPTDSPPPYQGAAHYPAKSNWKAQAAKAGARVLISALVGQYRHHHHHDRDA